MAQTPFRQRYVIPWSIQGVGFTAAVNQGYFTSASINVALPATASVGDVISISNTSGNFTITQTAGKTIHFGTTNTTTGVGGSVASTQAYSAITLVCSVANTDFVVINSVGNFTIV